MNVLGKKKLVNFCRRHAGALLAIQAWIAEAEDAQWGTPQDIKKRYASASFLPSNHVIFNLRGGRYRLEVQVAYKTGVVLVKRIGTHAEYDRWDR